MRRGEYMRRGWDWLVCPGQVKDNADKHLIGSLLTRTREISGQNRCYRYEKPPFSRNCADEQLTLFGDELKNATACRSKRRRVNGYGIRLGKELSMPEPLGVVRNYTDLLDVARARMAALSITFETLDAVSGVASGYSAKLLGPNPSKRLGAMSFAAVLGALGIELHAFEDQEALERLRPRLVKRRLRRVEHHWRHAPSATA